MSKTEEISAGQPIISFPRVEYNSKFIHLFHNVFAKLRGRGFVLRKLIEFFPGLNNVYLVHDDAKLWLDLRNNSDMGHFYLKGNHHEIALQFFLELLRNKETVFYDIGANMGYYPLVLHQQVKQVYAFEPNPLLITRLSHFVESNKLNNVSVFPVGLSNENGKLKFYYSVNRHDLGSFIQPDDYTDEVLVETVRLDDWMNSLHLLPPTIVKIDTEGYEIKVLQGFSNIRKSLPIIFMEWNRYDDTRDAYESLSGVIGDQYLVYKICSDNTLIQHDSHSNKFICYVLAIPRHHEAMEKIENYIVV